MLYIIQYPNSFYLHIVLSPYRIPIRYTLGILPIDKYTLKVYNRYMKVNIDLPEDMIKAVDLSASSGFFTRSEWIRVAIREKLGIDPKGIRVPDSTPTVENAETINEAPSEPEMPAITDDDTMENGFLKPGNPYDFDKMKPVKKWCGLNLTHPYTEPQDTYCITGEDENGNPVKHGKLTLVNIFGCAKCIESLPYTVMTGDTNG